MSSDENMDELYQEKLKFYKPQIRQMYSEYKIAKQKSDEGMIYYDYSNVVFSFNNYVLEVLYT